MKKNKDKLTKNYINRELSWLEFNDRVLEEAYDNDNPLFERLKFASIVSSNLDEFFMVRVASLYDQVMAGFKKPDPAGLTPKEQLALISVRAHQMVYEKYNCFNRSLVPLLKKEKVFFLKRKNLNTKQKEYIDTFYRKTLYPVLTPMVVDTSRPFPLILNKSLNIALLLKDKEAQELIFATIQVPAVLDRLVELPSEEGERCFILLEEIIKMYMDNLFSGHEIKAMGCYRITRNADQGLDEEGAEDLLEAIEQFIKKRKWGVSIRLEIESGMNEKLFKILNDELEVPEGGVYEISGPLDLTFLMKLYGVNGFDHLKYPTFTPQPSPGFMSEEEDIFKAISERDILVHHPFERFDPVLELVEEAADDPDVLAIKQTLYRVSGNSPIIEALSRAAENGKQVTVLVELKARFDEENNIIWAKRLEMAGCHVIYGLVGLKTHCKILLVVRREDDGIKRYVHMSTGNYNDVTARFYTDIGLFTSNPYFGADASAIFNMLSGYSKLTKLYKTHIAPIELRNTFLNLIEQEADNARKGKKAKIIVKVNSLVDEQIINALYDASTAGVQIDLIVRGICCLRPGIQGVSEKICVRSIVGRLLEHSRIYYFYNDGDELVYLSSADWMTRNLDRRVELLFPVDDPEIRERMKGILNICLKDAVKARLLNNDGTYSRVDKRGKELIDSQQYFYNEAVGTAKKLGRKINKEEFKPITSFG